MNAKYVSKMGFQDDTEIESAVLQQRSHEDIAVKVISDSGGFGFYGVYDGHGASKELGERHTAYTLAYGYKELSPLHEYVKEEIQKLENKSVKNLKECIRRSFFMFDTEMHQRGCYGGSCMSGIFVLTSKSGDRHIFIVNLGDSRSCAWVDQKIIYHTRDHTPQNSYEHERILKCGTPIIQNRVMGSLAVSRSFGDWIYKNFSNGQNVKSPVVAIPSVKYIHVRDDEELNFFVVSDGVYDTGINSEYLIQVINTLQVKGTKDIPKRILRMLASNNSTADDMSMVCGVI